VLVWDAIITVQSASFHAKNLRGSTNCCWPSMLLRFREQQASCPSLSLPLCRQSEMHAELVVVAHQSVVKVSGVVDHALIVTVLVPRALNVVGLNRWVTARN